MTATEAPSLTFLPGLNNDALTWAPVLRRLGEGFEARALDLPASADIGEVADDVAAAMSPGYLVGHSFGGAVAMEVLHRHPERVLGLCLVASSLGADSPEQARGRAERSGALLTEEAYLASAMAGMTSSFHALHAHQAEYRRERERSARAYGLARFRAHCLAIGGRADRTETVAAAVLRGLPVLVVAPEEDKVIPPARQEEFATNVGADFATVGTAGHMLPAEQPARLAEVLRAWVHATAH